MPRTDPHIDSISWFTYPDKGCIVSPTCLECPLPACRYDNPKWWLEWREWQKNRGYAFVAFFFGNISQASRVLGVSPRTIHRAIARVKQYNQWSAWAMEHPEITGEEE